jgi:hypothetical protein
VARRFRFRVLNDGDLHEFNEAGTRSLRAGETFELSEAEAAQFYRSRGDRKFELLEVIEEDTEEPDCDD